MLTLIITLSNLIIDLHFWAWVHWLIQFSWAIVVASLSSINMFHALEVLFAWIHRFVTLTNRCVMGMMAPLAYFWTWDNISFKKITLVSLVHDNIHRNSMLLVFLLSSRLTQVLQIRFIKSSSLAITLFICLCIWGSTWLSLLILSKKFISWCLKIVVCKNRFVALMMSAPVQLLV